ncbi:hypothetical protein BST83_14990 [Polaribacter filamentus]|uniref:Methyltransferase domain-containing protein n=1 Tax=Polaribacter filamentus TaxID=53483 RepID=A0A2S7L0B7_9FLAO|nr:class I SAM-dependent methyltransferase [Polaribacter filamentus]PQB08286.1 hypothetical protein BST83_14990 [Polaribacter filamentus]
MKLITLDDFIDTYFKIRQRGSSFLFSKFNFNNEKRTKSAFDNTSFISSNFWSIPKVLERWNLLITGKKDQNYIDFLTQDFLKDKSGLRLLSLGSGISNREIELAEHNTIFKEIVCVDIADNLLKIAAKSAKEKTLQISNLLQRTLTFLILKRMILISYFLNLLYIILIILNIFYQVK